MQLDETKKPIPPTPIINNNSSNNSGSNLCIYLSHIITNFIISAFISPFLFLSYITLWIKYLGLSKCYPSERIEQNKRGCTFFSLLKLCVFRPTEVINAHDDILKKSRNFINSMKLVLLSVMSSKELIINVLNYFIKPQMEEFEYELGNNGVHVFIPIKNSKLQTMILFVNNSINNEQKFKRAHMPLINSLIKEGYNVVLPILNPKNNSATTYIETISEINRIIDFISTNARLIGVCSDNLYLVAYHDLCLLVTIATIKQGIRTHKSTLKGLILFEGVYEIYALYKKYSLKKLGNYCNYLRKMTELMPSNDNRQKRKNKQEIFETMEKWSIPKILKNLKANVSDRLISKCLPKQFLIINSRENDLHKQAQKVFKVMDELNMDVEFKLYSNMPQINPLIYMCCSSAVGVSMFIINDINVFVDNIGNDNSVQ